MDAAWPWGLASGCCGICQSCEGFDETAARHPRNAVVVVVVARLIGPVMLLVAVVEKRH